MNSPPAATDDSPAGLPSEFQLELDPEKRERQRDLRGRALHAVYVPRLRLIGSVIICAWLYLHMRFISGGSFGEWAFASALLFAWGAAAWIILYRFYRRRARFDLAHFFLAGDLFLWTYLIYITGAERSWLFILLSVRAADQSPTTFPKTLYYAHLGFFLYLALLGFMYLRGEPVDWGLGWTKAGIIYGFNLYLALAARTMERMRGRMSSAIRFAIELIGDLKRSENELQVALSRSAELERSLAQAQKLESLGQMAAGIAHDFNNTMMSVLPWANLISKKYPDDPELSRASSQISNAVTRAREVTSHLLGFAQPRPPQIELVDLEALLEQQLDTLRLSVPENVRIEIERTASPCMVAVDTAQFAHAITNLVLNARDALPEGGVITFRIRDAEPHEQGRAEIHPGSHIALDVADTGTGMDEETMTKVFDPFFTTKPFGQGSGLGLAVAHQMVTQAGGILSVRSEPGRGSAFTILLPCAERALPPSETRPVQEEAPQNYRGVDVMIVDDDPAVGEGIRIMLEMTEANVTLRSSGREALELLDRGFHPELIILDMGMPEMSGAEVHAAIRARNLRIPILISSGYGDPKRLDQILGDDATFYLQKPYELNDLLAMMQRALGSR
ncbi:MAG: response regulator [Acidobacteria bacterium]|nr:response regulator [Acidobacteriota bacterium]